MSRWLLIAGLALSPAALGLAQAPAPRARITGLHHVAFRVTDAAAARRFYGDLLGLTERPASGAARLSYAIGDRQHVVLLPGLPAGEDERLSHVAYETPDVKALASHLLSRGFTIQESADRCEPTAIRVADPDGHTIEFVQAEWPPTVSTTGSSRALSTRLLHAGLIIGDEPRAHTFYRDALGFSEIWRGGRPEGTTSWVNMRVPDGTDYLEYMMQTKPPDRRQRGVLHHLCLMVPSIQAAWEEAARRTPPAARSQLSPPSVGVNGKWQLNLYDPDGTRVELMEPFTVR